MITRLITRTDLQHYSAPALLRLCAVHSQRVITKLEDAMSLIRGRDGHDDTSSSTQVSFRAKKNIIIIQIIIYVKEEKKNEKTSPIILLRLDTF